MKRSSSRTRSVLASLASALSLLAARACGNAVTRASAPKPPPRSSRAASTS